jgi:hypothetical protein
MSEEIRQFIAKNREIATVQAQRWQGVDPSRLLQALDYLEGMLIDIPINGETYMSEGISELAKLTEKAVSTLADIAELRDTSSHACVVDLSTATVMHAGNHIIMYATGSADDRAIEQIAAAIRQDAHMKVRLLL